MAACHLAPNAARNDVNRNLRIPRKGPADWITAKDIKFEGKKLSRQDSHKSMAALVADETSKMRVSRAGVRLDPQLS